MEIERNLTRVDAHRIDDKTKLEELYKIINLTIRDLIFASKRNDFNFPKGAEYLYPPEENLSELRRVSVIKREKRLYKILNPEINLLYCGKVLSYSFNRTKRSLSIDLPGLISPEVIVGIIEANEENKLLWLRGEYIRIPFKSDREKINLMNMWDTNMFVDPDGFSFFIPRLYENSEAFQIYSNFGKEEYNRCKSLLEAIIPTIENIPLDLSACDTITNE